MLKNQRLPQFGKCGRDEAFERMTMSIHKNVSWRGSCMGKKSRTQRRRELRENKYNEAFKKVRHGKRKEEGKGDSDAVRAR
jgi:hypothetical protein